MIEKLELGNLTELKELYCDGNRLTKLDVTNQRKLDFLYCSDNLLADLDISNNKILCALDCQKNKIKELDISNCKILQGDYFLDFLYDPGVKINKFFYPLKEVKQTSSKYLQVFAACHFGLQHFLYIFYCINCFIKPVAF